MITIEAKLYLTPAQITILEAWLRTCCAIYNRALEQRKKAYCRRGESLTYNQQQSLLTKQRSRGGELGMLPVLIERDALRRVDRGMQAFFRRLKSGEKPGFPRFRSHRRYDSLEFAGIGSYVRTGDLLMIPKLGLVKFRSGPQQIPKTQRVLRIIRRASGWYAQVIVDQVKTIGDLEDCGPIGLDMGLESFATTSNGEQIENPRFYRKSMKRRRGLQRSISRKRRGSKNRRKAVLKLRKHEEKVALQRRNFCHQHSTELVRKHPLIAVEKLNIKGMSRSRFAKSIADAGWGTFLSQLAYKAASAGRELVAVNPSGTSQECPDCGAVRKKSLSERSHSCACGLRCHRDHASARVILARALVATGATRLRRDSASGGRCVAEHQADPLKQVDKPLT